MAKLIDACIESLVEHGYHNTSVAKICRKAGVSQGGMFRHFPTRTALVAAATDEICKRHLQRFGELIATPPEGDIVTALAQFCREATRDDISHAWREVLVAARTDRALADEIYGPVYRFEQALMDAAVGLTGEPRDRARAGTLLMSLLHMFDSEASTVGIVDNDEVELLRHEWTCSILRRALAGDIDGA